jgi:erythritol transport system ATP-binding protein
MSDRVLVLSKGAITAEFARDEATEEELVAASAIGHGPTVSREASTQDTTTKAGVQQ